MPIDVWHSLPRLSQTAYGAGDLISENHFIRFEAAMKDAQYNGKRLFKYLQAGPAKYDIVGNYIREAGKGTPVYEIRGEYIYKADSVGQPAYEIKDNFVYQHLIAGQPIFEIK